MYQIVCGIVLLSKGESCEKSAHAPRSCRDAKWHVRSPMVRQDSKWHAGNRRAEPTQTKWNAGCQESRADGDAYANKMLGSADVRRRRTNHRRGLAVAQSCQKKRLRLHVPVQLSSRRDDHRSRGETPWKAHGADELKTSHMISGMARTNKSSYTNSRTLKIPGANGGCRRRGPARIAARLKRPYVKLPFPEPLTEVPRGSDMALRRLVAQPSRAPRRPRLRSKCARPPGSRAPRPLLRAPPHPG